MVLVDPLDPADIARGITEALDRRDELAAAGPPAALYSWARTAEAVVAATRGARAVPAVAVNLLWCVPGKVGGSEEYVTRLLVPLATEAPDLDLTLFVFRVSQPPILSSPIGTRSSWRRSVAIDAACASPSSGHGWRPRSGGAVRAHHHGGTAPPGSGPVPVVLSMHDIQYVAYPEYFGTVKLAWLRHELPSSLARARVITTPSEFVATSLVDAHDVDPARLAVVPHGLRPASRRRPSMRVASAPDTGSPARSSCTRRDLSAQEPPRPAGCPHTARRST